MRAHITLAAAAALMIGGLATAEAAPFAPPTAEMIQAEVGITQVAQGCGPGFARGPYGGCRPFYGRRFYGPRPAYGRRCFIRPTPYGPRRVCRF